MATFEYVSARGDVLTLSENDYFVLTNIDAQTSAATSISSAAVGGVDGDRINEIRANPRTIIIDLRLKGNIEDSKRAILRIVKLKQSGAIVWTQNNRTVKITGIVESIDMPRWNNGVTMQITLHCSTPYWENVSYVISQISEAISLHYFTDIPNEMLYFPDTGIALGEYDTTRTKQFYNEGDVAVGLEIEILAISTVTNPIITNADGEYFGVGNGTGTRQVVMSSGDKIVIKTGKNAKSVTLNDSTNLLSKIKPSSTWLQLAAGDNSFTINSDDDSIDNVSFTLKYKERYI